MRVGTVSVSFLFQAVGPTAGPVLTGLLLQRMPVSSAFVALGVLGGGLGSAFAMKTAR